MISQPSKAATTLCAVLAAVYLAAPFCSEARPQAKGCCDPATGCGAGAGLSAPDCCQLDAGRSGSAQHPTIGLSGAPAPQSRCAAWAGGIDAGALAAGFATADSPRSTGDPPPLYLLNVSLLR